MVSSSSFHRVVFKSQKKDYGDGFYFFLSFVLIIFFYSSFFFSLQASTDAYKDMHLRFVIHLSIFVVDIFFFFGFSS